MVAVPTNVAMMQARTTDGDKPVIKAYAHSNVMVMMPRTYRMEVYRRGYSIIQMMRPMIPVCSPLTANMCDKPAAEKY